MVLTGSLGKTHTCLGLPITMSGVCDAGDLGSIPGLGRSSGEEERLPTPVFSGLENSMDCVVHGGRKKSDMTVQLSLSWVEWLPLTEAGVKGTLHLFKMPNNIICPKLLYLLTISIYYIYPLTQIIPLVRNVLPFIFIRMSFFVRSMSNTTIQWKLSQIC